MTYAAIGCSITTNVFHAFYKTGNGNYLGSDWYYGVVALQWPTLVSDLILIFKFIVLMAENLKLNTI